MNLSGLVPLLKQLPAYRALIAQRDSTPQALLQAARPLIVAGLKQDLPGPLVLLTARSEMAQQLATQLEAWLPPVEEGGPPVLIFAEPDALPYERIAWSGYTRQQRLTALAALQSRGGNATGGKPIVVASARALMQKTLPASKSVVLFAWSR
jgi:transcription-repair coupling factor (superfamily II helicase)